MNLSEPGGAAVMAERSSTGARVVLTVAGDGLVGLPLERCREVVPPRPVTPLPGTSAAVLGLVNLRGRLITVIDLGRALGRAASSDSADHGIVIVDRGRGQAGLAVEQVVHIVDLPHSPAAADERGLRIFPLDPHSLPDSDWKDAGVFACLELDALLDSVLG